jgi:hypothetical protein
MGCFWHIGPPLGSDLPFISFPIANNESVKNEGLEKATKAFKERMTYNHPLFARTLELFFDF